ncbi:MAG TPA: histidine phosphatase family protein [Tissierellia bacterium]|nr:histidine phosphatase family protein [Tissierellia bacterium]
MTKIYITRHGETVWNRECKYQGHKDSDLTEKGIIGAELLSERIEEIDIDYIISSPLGRAYKTAEIVRGNKDIEIIKHEGLKELNLGEFEGMKYEEIKREYPAILEKIEADPLNQRYPNGESLREFYGRVEKALNEILEKYKNKTILIVAHGGTIKCIEAFVKKSIRVENWIETVVYNCSLSYIEVDENNEVRKVSFNDISHLKGTALA